MPPSSAGRSLTGTIALAPYSDRFARVLGSTLTPQQVTAILAQAELGYLWGQADLLDEVRERDGHLHAELQKRELRVASAAWELSPPEGSGDRGVEVSQFCTARLDELDARGDMDRSFPDALTDLLGAIYQGRAAMETTWRTEGRWTIPATLSFLHPRRLAYTTDWRLHLWDASGTATTADAPTALDGPFGRFPGLALDRFPAGKFIVHRPRVRGVYPTREGLGRLLVWWSTFKRFTTRDFLAYAEWAGRGLRIGTYATGKGPMGEGGPMGENVASPEDQAVLLQAMDQISSAVAVILADTTKAEVLSAPTNNDVHGRLVQLCNDEISKATVGGTLGSSVSKAGGSRSQGEVHERGELMIAKADARSLAATLRRDLLAPLVRMNFGASAPVPRIVFAVDPAADLDGLAKRMVAWKSMGGTIGQRTGANALQLPEIDPTEELLPSAAASSPSPPTAPDESPDDAETS